MCDFLHAGSFWGVFWITGDSDQAIRESIYHIATQMGYSGGLRSFADYLSIVFHDKECLFVVDDVQDIPYQLEEWLSTAPGANILVTTTKSWLRQYGNLPPTYFILTELDPAHAVKLFLEHLGYQEPLDVSTLESTLEFLTPIGFLPLAVTQLAKMLKTKSRPELGYMDLSERLRQFNSSVQSAPIPRDNVGSVLFYTSSLAHAFDRALRDLTPTALNLLRVLAFMHPDAIPASMFTRAMLSWNSRHVEKPFPSIPKI